MSKKVDFYRQCTMMRKLTGSTEHTTSWIPDCFAKVGSVLKLRDKEGKWVNGWEVISASPPMEARLVEMNSRSYLHQRQASDVCFKKIKEENAE